jgi:hypothetical protein
MSNVYHKLVFTLIVSCCAGLTWAGEQTPASAKPIKVSETAATPLATATVTTTPTATAAATATTPVTPAKIEALDDRIQDIKSDVIKLNRDLLVLEEELLFPANTQVVLFVSLDVGKMFELDSVQVKIDDKLIANYLYTPLEVQALHRGGVQRLYLGNLRAGEHEIVAFFTGGGPHARDYKRGTTIKFTKDTQAKYVELRIRDSQAKLQPEFDVKVWQ